MVRWEACNLHTIAHDNDKYYDDNGYLDWWLAITRTRTWTTNVNDDDGNDEDDEDNEDDNDEDGQRGQKESYRGESKTSQRE